MINNNKENINSVDDEINLRYIFNTLRRSKKFIFGIVLLSTLYSTIYSYTTKEKWAGSFEIVVKKEEDNNTSNRMGNLSSLLNLSNSNSELETQRLILKSPSVLMPVYEFVKSYYEKNGIDTKNLNFKNWLEDNLFVNFEDETSVLKVEYKNQDKKLILESLELISSKYKDYSKRDTERQINKTIAYIEKQTEIMKEKSENSIKRFNEYSLKYGLGSIDGFVGFGNTTSLQENNKALNLSINLRNLGESKNVNRSEISSNQAGIRFNSQFKLLEEYEALFADLSSKLKPNSKTLIQLDTKIKNLKEKLKRPNQILVEYRKLNSEAVRDENILLELENALQLLQLNKVKNPDPWEMISVPTLDPNPIYPQKKKFIFSGIILGLIIGSIISLLKEKLSGVIFEKDDFTYFLRYIFLDEIYKKYNDINKIIINNSLNLNQNETQVGLVYLNDDFFKSENIISPDYLKGINNLTFISLVNINNLRNCSQIILIAEEGKITFKNLNLIDKYLLPHKNKIKGWFFLK